MTIIDGFDPNKDLPFYGDLALLSPEEAFNKASIIFDPKKDLPLYGEAFNKVMNTVANNHKAAFLKEFEMYHNALTLIGKRYHFYAKILKQDIDTIIEYESQIGSVYLFDRAAYASHHCILKGEKLVEKMEKMIKDFLSGCLEKERIAGDCDMSFMNEPFSDCEKTGVCICAGKQKPFMHSCVNDSSILLRDSKTAKEDLGKAMTSFNKRILLEEV